MNVTNDTSVFGCILNVVCSNHLYLYLTKYKTLGFKEHLRAYEVEPESQLLLNYFQLPDIRSVNLAVSNRKNYVVCPFL